MHKLLHIITADAIIQKWFKWTLRCYLQHIHSHIIRFGIYFLSPSCFRYAQKLRANEWYIRFSCLASAACVLAALMLRSLHCCQRENVFVLCWHNRIIRAHFMHTPNVIRQAHKKALSSFNSAINAFAFGKYSQSRYSFRHWFSPQCKYGHRVDRDLR